MRKAKSWPALAEPTPPWRRHVPRLSHGIARNHQVMNPSVFGRTEAHISHGSERGGRKGVREKETKYCRSKDRRRAVLGHTYISSTQSATATDRQSVNLE